MPEKVKARVHPHPHDGLSQNIAFRAVLGIAYRGDKVDFWILTEEPFDQSRFSRRYSEAFIGTEMQVSSPEDTILAKLRWAKLSGGSEKHFTDALRVYEVQYGKLNRDYLEYWVKQLDVESLWKRLIDEAEPA